MAERAGDVMAAQVLIEWLPRAGLIDLQGQGDVMGPLAQRLNIRLPASANCWLNSPGDVQRTMRSIPVRPGEADKPVEPAIAAAEPLSLRACWLAPMHWMLFVPSQQDSDWVRAIETCCPNAVATHVSDAYCGVRVVGPGAAELLAQGCPLDLDHLLAGHAARSLIARCSVLLLATESEGVAFELWVERSYQNYLANWLSAANATRGSDEIGPGTGEAGASSHG